MVDCHAVPLRASVSSGCLRNVPDDFKEARAGWPLNPMRQEDLEMANKGPEEGREENRTKRQEPGALP